MSEKLLIKSNGQWDLVKWDKNHQDKAAKWVDSGNRKHLKDLPHLTGDKRSQMFEDMKAGTEHRINPDTGEIEFLLHRHHVHEDPFTAHPHPLGIDPKKDPKGVTPEHERSPLTSWSVDSSFPEYWKENSGGKGHITSTWVPHHQIHSYMPTGLKDHWKDEGEVLVDPKGKFD